MFGVIPVINGNLEEPIKDVSSISEDSSLLLGMVTCHSLTMIEEELRGDPLDVKVCKKKEVFMY